MFVLKLIKLSKLHSIPALALYALISLNVIIYVFGAYSLFSLVTAHMESSLGSIVVAIVLLVIWIDGFLAWHEVKRRKNERN